MDSFPESTELVPAKFNQCPPLVDIFMLVGRDYPSAARSVCGSREVSPQKPCLYRAVEAGERTRQILQRAFIARSQGRQKEIDVAVPANCPMQENKEASAVFREHDRTGRGVGIGQQKRKIRGPEPRARVACIGKKRGHLRDFGRVEDGSSDFKRGVQVMPVRLVPHRRLLHWNAPTPRRQISIRSEDGRKRYLRTSTAASVSIAPQAKISIDTSLHSAQV